MLRRGMEAEAYFRTVCVLVRLPESTNHNTLRLPSEVVR